LLERRLWLRLEQLRLWLRLWLRLEQRRLGLRLESRSPQSARMNASTVGGDGTLTQMPCH
jgi:hypothetical protein